jgi:hypothetical protein
VDLFCTQGSAHPIPLFEIVAPRETDARVVVEATPNVLFGKPGAMEKHECFTDRRIIAKLIAERTPRKAVRRFITEKDCTKS